MSEEISDKALGALILGLLAGTVINPDFPVDLREGQALRLDYDDDGHVESFEFVTQSGVQYRVAVHLLSADQNPHDPGDHFEMGVELAP